MAADCESVPFLPNIPQLIAGSAMELHPSFSALMIDCITTRVKSSSTSLTIPHLGPVNGVIMFIKDTAYIQHTCSV